jgi:hypothetical protein
MDVDVDVDAFAFQLASMDMVAVIVRGGFCNPVYLMKY